VTSLVIGYARTSLFADDAEQQRAELTALGAAPDRVYLDAGLVGMTRPRPALGEALAALRSGDTLVVTALFRLARSTTDAAGLVERLIARQVQLVVGDVLYAMDGSALRVLVDGLEIAGAVRSTRHSRRTREGLRAARASRQRKGRPPKKPEPGAVRRRELPRGPVRRHRPERAVRRLALHRLPRPAASRTRRCNSGQDVIDRVLLSIGTPFGRAGGTAKSATGGVGCR